MIKVVAGLSQKDTITFYASNFMEVTGERIATLYTANESHQSIEEIPQFKFHYSDEEEYHKVWKSLIKVILMIFGIASLIKAVVLMPLIERNIISIYWYLVPAIYYLCWMILAVFALRYTGGIELLRNHGAEHKVYKAYKKLKRVPTVEEAEKFFRITKLCGVTVFSAFITSQIIGYIVYIYFGFAIPEIVLFLIPIFFRTIFPFYFIGEIAQLFTTAKPKRRNLELAIATIAELERIVTEEENEQLIDI